MQNIKNEYNMEVKAVYSISRYIEDAMYINAREHRRDMQSKIESPDKLTTKGKDKPDIIFMWIMSFSKYEVAILHLVFESKQFKQSTNYS